MDRFDSMTAFARVIELGSFTKAADSLHLPKTTLSAQIAALERRLGIRLLHRTTRSVGATPEELDAHLVCRLFSARIRGFFDCNFIRDGVRHDVKGRHVTAYNDIESALAGALAGLGIVQLPRYILDESIAAGRLVPILGDYRSEPVPIHLLYPQQRLLSAKVKAFASWVQALFAATRHVIAPE